MNANTFNHHFQQGMPPGQHGYLQQSQGQVPFPAPSQMQLHSAYWPSPQGQAWPPLDRFTPSVLPGTQQGVPQWAQAQVVAQQQQLLQPIGDLRQCLQQPSLPQHPMQGYHPQPVQEYYPQPSVQQHRAQHSVQEGLSQQSVQDLVAAVAVQLGYTRNVDSESARAIAQCANNDKVVIDALKQGKAKGLNGLVAIEKLGNVSGHANALWKNYALARLDKISPKVYPTCTISGAARSGVSSSRSGSRKRPSSGGLKHTQRSQPAATSNCTGIDNHANPSYFMDRRLGHDNQAYQPSSPISEREGPSTNVQVRSRRGGPIPEYHAGTLITAKIPTFPPCGKLTKACGKASELKPFHQSFIAAERLWKGAELEPRKAGTPIVPKERRLSKDFPPWLASQCIPPLAPSSQPKPPLRDPDNNHEGHRFTDEDKIFFIHFLKSYLGQGRGARIPEREDLYLLLARQTPHHNAEAWKRHWDDAPELPDKIYIEARKRADDEALARSASLSPSSNEDGSEDGIDAADDGPTSPVLNRVQRTSCTPRRPKTAKKGVEVTEEDLREMVQYKYERRDVWDQFPNMKARWNEFAQRPQNLKRSSIAWYSVERDHNKEFNRYYKEYAASAAAASNEGSELAAESELEYVDVTTPPQHDAGSASVSSTSSGPDTQAADEALVLPGLNTVPQKRGRTDSETACSTTGAEEGFPAAKRMKEEEDEKPEIIVVDSD